MTHDDTDDDPDITESDKSDNDNIGEVGTEDVADVTDGFDSEQKKEKVHSDSYGTVILDNSQAKLRRTKSVVVYCNGRQKQSDEIKIPPLTRIDSVFVSKA
ncbi:hypothetical protein F2P81_007478 [Scophthalmus maximus]|uniref:Uncharacterized protein n=1 Tax=Scophthalmus maximus TaxID=52904 RepID=A0A6A4SZH6_SCOMX|nr:hypothetical protein F2P81_007478 [Scophthalmus maximus]